MSEHGTQLEELLAEMEGGREVLDAMKRERPQGPSTDPDAARRLSDDNELLSLEAEGVIKRGTGKLPDNFWDLQRPDDPDNSVRRALEEDRQ